MIKKIKVMDLKIGHTIILDGKQITLSKSNLKNIDCFFNTRNVNGISMRPNDEVKISLFKHYVHGKFHSLVEIR